MFKIINCTPHDIDFIYYDDYTDSRNVYTFESDKSRQIRLKEHLSSHLIVPLDEDNDNNIRVEIKHKTYLPSSTYFPPVEQGVFYIVSTLVQQYFPTRGDFIVPNEIVRDEEGKIIGCKSFSISEP